MQGRGAAMDLSCQAQSQRMPELHNSLTESRKRGIEQDVEILSRYSWRKSTTLPIHVP
jgi:hypothetical protein